MSTYNLKGLVKQKSCFKNTENPSCIDLILTNSKLSVKFPKTTGAERDIET